jgi:putative tryptophan/tyrosine transport system substrate-binding protein
MSLLGGAAAWPLGANAQQTEPMRRIGLLMNVVADHPTGRAGLAAFRQALELLGWNEGGNLRIDIRWGANDPDLDRKYAAELAALKPDVILAAGTLSVAALQRVAHIPPIVFVQVTDPVGAGFVDTLARPGGNITGFMLFEYSMAGKWLELLKEIAPRLARAAVLRDTGNPAASAQFGAIQALAPSLGVEVSPIGVSEAAEAGEIAHAVAAFARGQNSGLIVAPSASNTDHRDLIVTLAARHRLPAVYGDHLMVAEGGLISYGPDRVDAYRRSAAYVDRILKGEKPRDLPVQAPTKYELLINLKSAKGLGLEVPAALLARADAVIE